MAKKMGAKCAVGGKITGPGGVDKVPLQATAGEYMLPVKTVQAIGVPTLDALVRQTNGKEPGPKMVAGTERAAMGGEIGKGIVDTVKNLFGFGAAAAPPEPPTSPTPPAPARPYQTAPPVEPTPTPELLGWGAARNAGQAIRARRRQIDEAAGYADGGEIVDDRLTPAGQWLRRAISGKLPPSEPGARLTPAGQWLRQTVFGGAPLPATQKTARPAAAGPGEMWSLRIPTEHMGQTPIDRATENAQRAAWGAKPLPEPAVAAPEPSQQTGGPQAPQVPAFVRPTPVQDTFENTAKGGSLASFFGAAMNQKRLSQAEQVARDQAAVENAFNLETAKFGAAIDTPASLKNAYEAEILRRRIALADTMKDPDARAALLVGQFRPAEKVTYPEGLQPMPSAEGPQYATVARGANVFRVPIRTQTQLQKGEDGKTYVLGPDGNALREASPSEISSMSAR